jgi:hypothetical protein
MATDGRIDVLPSVPRKLPFRQIGQLCSTVDARRDHGPIGEIFFLTPALARFCFTRSTSLQTSVSLSGVEFAGPEPRRRYRRRGSIVIEAGWSLLRKIGRRVCD